MNRYQFPKLTEARDAALRLSRQNPAKYYAIASCFGWIVIESTRLSVFAPSDYSEPFGRTGTYWKNGLEKPFTEAQRSADDRATPVMH